MERREQEFFEWFSKIEPYLHLYNTRQIWDIAYNAGKTEGLEFGLAVMKGENK